MISNKQQLKYPNGRRGYCGDAYNETKWDVPGTIQNTYRSGQTINIDVVVTTNHMGRFSVQICPLEAKRGEGKCKNLYLRVAGHKGIKSWYLPGIKGWTGGNWGGNGPKYGGCRGRAEGCMRAGLRVVEGREGTCACVCGKWAASMCVRVASGVLGVMQCGACGRQGS